MDFRLWLEQEEDSWTLRLAAANADETNSLQQHIPAEDCYKKVEWQTPFLSWPKGVEELLQKAKATVHPGSASWLTYHVCSVAFYVNVQLQDKAIAEQLEQLLKGSKTEGKPDMWKNPPNWPASESFPFTGYKDAILQSIKRKDRNLSPPKELAIAQAYEPTSSKPRETGKGIESRENYWKRLIQADQMRDKIQRRKSRLTREGD